MYTKHTETHRYDDIIDLPHHISSKHPRMPRIDRAAQFSPFAALTGYDAAIVETARLTQEYVELDETSKLALNEKLQMIRENPESHPDVTITYYIPDEKKDGGAYVHVTGQVRKIDEYKRVVVMKDNTAIPIDQIYEIESSHFRQIVLQNPAGKAHGMLF